MYNLTFKERMFCIFQSLFLGIPVELLYKQKTIEKTESSAKNINSGIS